MPIVLTHACRAGLVVLFLSILQVSAAGAQKIVDVEIGSGEGRSYGAKLYIPASLPAPAVLVLHTFYGFVAGEAEDFDRAFGQALAKEGYLSLVPNYAHASLRDRPHQPAIIQDLARIADWLAARTEASGKPIGVVGFSIGAAHAVRLAAANPNVKAVVGYYGVYNLATQPSVIAAMKGRPTPPSSVDAAGAVNSSILLLHGTADDETRIDQANDMKAALEKDRKRVELVTYAGAYHRFDRGPNVKMKGEKTPEGHTYKLNPAARDDAWRRTLIFLREQLK